MRLRGRRVVNTLFYILPLFFVLVLVGDMRHPRILSITDRLLSRERDDPTTIPTVDTTKSISDKSRKFRTVMFSIVPDMWTDLSSSKICLGSQTSVDRLFNLVEQMRTWTGPFSLSVFTPGMELPVAMTYIRFLRTCFPAIKNQVAFHFTFPDNRPGHTYLPGLENVRVPDCMEYESYLKDLLGVRSEAFLLWRETMAYPQNLLRNIAKNTCQANFTLIPDIDMMMIPNMTEQIHQWLDDQEHVKTCLKCVYIVPTYEILRNVSSPPRTKSELLQLTKTGVAQVFHFGAWKKNSRATNLPVWESLPIDEKLSPAYKIDYELFYEPLYIAPPGIPEFDERFVGYGYTRNSQIYHMFLENYEFYVLNNVFTYAWDFQEKTYPDFRLKQKKENGLLFRTFAREMSARYGKDPFNLLDKYRELEEKENSSADSNLAHVIPAALQILPPA